jgi:hypothetical protein
VRRGSVPADVGCELRLRNGSSNKSRTRKKVLRRRSSGGPEMFTVSGSEPLGDGMMWQQWHREFLSRWKAESVLARRRGSLPIEVLATTHSGELVLLGQFILLCYLYPFSPSFVVPVFIFNFSFMYFVFSFVTVTSELFHSSTLVLSRSLTLYMWLFDYEHQLLAISEARKVSGTISRDFWIRRNTSKQEIFVHL